MDENRISRLLDEMAKQTSGPVRPGLAHEIKRHIPAGLTTHHRGMHTISIMIDLRVSRLAAAGIVIISMILLAAVLGRVNSTGGGLYQESKLLAEYLVKGDETGSLSTGNSLRRYLLEKGREVVYYGNNIDPEDSNSILLHWKVSKDTYKVVFSNLQERQVSAAELIELQAKMLQKQTK
jgi:hypothetical protein